MSAWWLAWAAGAAVLVAVAAYWAWYLWGPLPGYRRIRLAHDGLDRRYWFHAPARPRAGEPLDVVLVMHGAYDYARRLAHGTHWPDLADQNDFAVAFPEATHPAVPRIAQAWNAGHCCMHAVAHDIDDVGFLAAVRDDILRRTGRPLGRLFLCGYSNGGMLAYRFATLRSDEVAAVAAVGAALWSGPTDAPDLLRPNWLPRVPVVHVHGRSDRVVPYRGGPGRGLATWHWSSVEQTLAAWAGAWHATPEAEQQATATVRRTQYRDENGRPCIVLYDHDAGHSWPGERRPFFLERADQSLQAEQAIWRDWQAMAADEV